jgi:hypothetical protein
MSTLEQRAAYQRQWRNDHLERANEIARKARAKRYADPVKRAESIAYSVAWRKAHPERVRERTRASNRRQKEAKAGRPRPAVCEVCGRPPGKKALAFDHDHATGEFRGWLCLKCNVALGVLDDDPRILRALVDYLEGKR